MAIFQGWTKDEPIPLRHRLASDARRAIDRYEYALVDFDRCEREGLYSEKQHLRSDDLAYLDFCRQEMQEAIDALPTGYHEFWRD